MQETVQGIRIVKAFTLEDIMRKRFDRNVAAVEHEANKMARVSQPREPADGNARRRRHRAWPSSMAAIACIETGATPGRVLLLHHRVPARL